MTAKTLLTFHTMDEPISHINSAIEVARVSNTHLDILVLGVLITPPVAVHGVVPGTEWITHNNETMSAAEERVNKIEKLVAKEGVSASIIAVYDYLSEIESAVARYTLCTDAVLIHKSCLEDNEVIAKSFNGTLFETGCPVLILPDQEVDIGAMGKIAIAWNGRAEAAKAIHRSLPLLQKANEVHLVIVDPNEKHLGEDPGNDIASFLARYGIAVTVDVLPSGGKSIEEKLLHRAKEIDADLLIMGAYGHSKLRQWLIGGTTTGILKKAEIPVLMAH